MAGLRLAGQRAIFCAMQHVRSWRDYLAVMATVAVLVVAGNRWIWQTPAFTQEQAAAFAAPLVGPARIVDGDTLEIMNGHKEPRIRLYGIDAPELHQTCKASGQVVRCGLEARDALIEMTNGQTIGCEPKDWDKYGRVVAVCYLNPTEPAKRQDINAALVSQGWAVAYRKYSLNYVPQENEAKAATRGLWAEAFEMPEDWRRAN